MYFIKPGSITRYHIKNETLSHSGKDVSHYFYVKCGKYEKIIIGRQAV
jgi:hypothetical protein